MENSMNRMLMISFALSVLFSPTMADAKDYTAKKGDTLAKIARSYYGEPVFGPGGTIGKIYELNPWAKKAGSLLEPGQKIVLEDKDASKAGAKAAVLPAHKSEPKSEPQVEAETEAEEPAKIAAPVVTTAPAPGTAPVAATVAASEPEKCPEAVACPACPAPVVCQALQPSFSTAEEPMPRAGLMVLPKYELIQQRVTDSATSAGYSIQSSQAYGVELAWDHWWNKSFSTVLSYAFLQVSSTEKSEVSGATVVDNVVLNRGEFTMFNRMTNWMRIGIGLGYGDHFFLEQFTAVPSDAKIFKTDFWHALVSAEVLAVERKTFDLKFGLKVAALPAQVGQGHDLSKGTEFTGDILLIQKFDSSAVVYGISYSTGNQSRTNANETREEWIAKLGFLF